jgi:hypothetical protein
MAYRIAGIDVHKKMVAVAIADVEIAETWRFERRQIGTSPNHLRALAEWLVERAVDEVVMESTAQYWRSVWKALERFWQPRQRQRPGAPSGEALGRAGADVELRAGRDAAAVAHGRAAQISIDLQSGAAAKPSRLLARGDAHRVPTALGIDTR